MGRKIPAERLPVAIGNGVCRIQLTHGKFALIDESDADRVSVCYWFAHMRTKNPEWYATGVVNGKQIRLHRHIMGLAPGDKRQVDHINGDVSDNRRSNLRIVDNTQNNQNRRSARSRTGLKGVSCSCSGTFTSSIHVDGTRIHLGNFPDPIAAAKAYDAAALEHFGEFAATNAELGFLDQKGVA
jgi:hypothetical protein